MIKKILNSNTKTILNNYQIINTFMRPAYNKKHELLWMYNIIMQ